MWDGNRDGQMKNGQVVAVLGGGVTKHKFTCAQFTTIIMSEDLLNGVDRGVHIVNSRWQGWCTAKAGG